MRSILEKALIALLNEEKDKADALFHDFILERSRQIHESLRQGEDFVLDESWEQELSIDEMFSEADLAEEDDDFAPGGEEAADGSEEAPAADADADADAPVADADADGAVDGEEEQEERPIEDRVEDLEAELQRLAAEFDAALGGEEEGDELGMGDQMGDEIAPEGDDMLPAPVAHETDEAFESLEEGIVDTLEKVSVEHSEGKTTGGDKQKVDTASRVKNTPVDKRQAGEPVKIKSAEHSGYDRETAPKSGHLPKGRNTLSSGEQGRTSVKKEGDGSALLNKGGEDKSNQHSLFDKKRV